ncbi:antiviral reverse transcriptase Drt3b [Saccharicrinis fermentans]|uniref:antiviral reverse transcriptase Drt3b n=3 Tax=Saccharicrinis fermentans TaxID=982 RepID=UPI0004B555F7|nr:antiviral reverse transcriptase Drt3b [Saccharicrinis fermentans]
MRNRKGKIIGYKKERVVLSDILPYEVPPYFSNRYFYNFLVNKKVCLVGDELRFKKDNSKITEQIIRLLFGFDKTKTKKSFEDYDYYQITDKNLITIPFSFRIAHKDDDYRELAVIHPINQLQLVQFYDKYKSNIKDATNKSQFSLRKPSKVASLKYYKDKTHTNKHSNNEEIEIIESSNKEYTSLKTYFSYQTCSNIFEFYESYEYQRAEKRFDKLLKFDISRCFDSIYTHSITWALLNKRAVKEYLAPKFKTTFGHKFDEMMQRMNYNETSGIVIGPEFSRIFAEIILQRVDKEVEKALYQLKLENEGDSKFEYKKGYDVYRYVDDYFVFYSDDSVKSEILKLYKIELQKYNLYFNESKTELFSKPIITNITIAKEEIRKLVEHSLIFKLDKDESRSQLGIKYYSAKDIITNYKLILANTNTSYKDLQNYFLVIIFNKVRKMVSQIGTEQKKLLKMYKDIDNIEAEELEKQEKIVKVYFNNIFDNFNEIIELSFFVYTVLPRVSYSIKLCHILHRIIDFVKNQEKSKQKLLGNDTFNDDKLKYIAFDFDRKHSVYKKIYDGILMVFSKNKTLKYAQIETLYLLPIVNELGEHYSFSEETIFEHFRINEKEGSELNYFTIISLLNHIENKKEYRRIRRALNKITRQKISNYESSKAEDVYLLVDLLVCPYVADKEEDLEDFRLKILNKIGFFEDGVEKPKKKEILKLINKQLVNVYCDWNNKNYGVELNTKRGHSVY